MKLPADLQRTVDETHAVVRIGYPWWLPHCLMRGVAGITLGRRVYLHPRVGDLERLLRHELVHVRQIRQLGALRFYGRYLREYAANRWQGLGPAEAYRRISLEEQAFAAEGDESPYNDAGL